MNPTQLPSSPQLDIRALSRLFRHTTTSYKYLFFLALLRTLRNQGFSADRAIPQREIDIEMLILAWSFVAHDQLWNLVPVAPEANSSKGDALPSRVYFEDFVSLQVLGLRITQELMPQRKWRHSVEPFFSDLRIATMKDLFEPKRLSEAYQTSLEPLFSLAANQGFALNWRYGKTDPRASF